MEHVKNYDGHANKCQSMLLIDNCVGFLQACALGIEIASLQELKKDMDVEVSIVRRTCVLLLAELMRVRQVVKAKVRAEAVKLALEWKEKIREGIVVK